MSKMRNRKVLLGDLYEIKDAIACLKQARGLLTRAGAHHAADKVRQALKSAEGALRHADGMVHREVFPKIPTVSITPERVRIECSNELAKPA